MPYFENNQEIFAYWAGLFDGEGHVRIAKTRAGKSGKSYYSLQATIVNTNPKPLEWIRNHHDGSLRIRKPTESWRQCYTLTLQGEGVVEFLSSIRPYSIIKAQEIDVALEFFKTHARPGTHGPFKSQLITTEEFQSMENYKQRLESIRKGGAVPEEVHLN